MRISKTLIIAFIISSSYTILTSSCKKEKNNTQSTTPATPISPANYTEGSLMGITLISIPNSSLFYDANGADIYKEFCINTASNFIISSHNNPIVNVQDSQFPIVDNYSIGYSVLSQSITNYYVKVYDEDVSNDGQSSDQYIGMISFTWNDLISNNSNSLTKSLNGTTIKINYSLR